MFCIIRSVTHVRSFVVQGFSSLNDQFCFYRKIKPNVELIIKKKKIIGIPHLFLDDLTSEDFINANVVK